MGRQPVGCVIAPLLRLFPGAAHVFLPRDAAQRLPDVCLCRSAVPLRRGDDGLTVHRHPPKLQSYADGEDGTPLRPEGGHVSQRGRGVVRRVFVAVPPFDIFLLGTAFSLLSESIRLSILSS